MELTADERLELENLRTQRSELDRLELESLKAQKALKAEQDWIEIMSRGKPSKYHRLNAKNNVQQVRDTGMFMSTMNLTFTVILGIIVLFIVVGTLGAIFN